MPTSAAGDLVSRIILVTQIGRKCRRHVWHLKLLCSLPMHTLALPAISTSSSVMLKQLLEIQKSPIK